MKLVEPHALSKPLIDRERESYRQGLASRLPCGKCGRWPSRIGPQLVKARLSYPRPCVADQALFKHIRLVDSSANFSLMEQMTVPDLPKAPRHSQDAQIPYV